MIGINISTRNRYHVLKYSLERFAKYKPEDSMIVVIDDDSVDWKRNKQLVKDYGFIYLKNEVRKGIPFSKERGFRCLKHCEVMFFFDDDTFPKVKGWEKPFIKGMKIKPHLAYLKKWCHIKPLGTARDGIVQYSGAAGCMMAFTKEMYPMIPGLGTGSMYGGWHHHLSLKLVGGYYSIENAQEYIYSFDIDHPPQDFDFAFNSSVSPEERKNKK